MQDIPFFSSLRIDYESQKTTRSDKAQDFGAGSYANIQGKTMFAGRELSIGRISLSESNKI